MKVVKNLKKNKMSIWGIIGLSILGIIILAAAIIGISFLIEWNKSSH